jgi:hypothetical protein
MKIVWELDGNKRILVIYGNKRNMMKNCLGT